MNQSDKLEIQGILSAGHEESSESFEPLPTPPRFDYSQYRDKINGFTPPAPRNYSPYMEGDESPDIGEDEESEELESLLRSFARDKQGREYSGDVLPSARTRGAIRAELSSMGLTWGE